MTIEPQDVIGKSVTWKGAQNKVSVRWKRKQEDGSSKSILDDVILPKLIELNMVNAGTYFVRIRYMRNPVNPGTDENPEILWVPAETYPNEKACRVVADAFYAEQEASEAAAPADGSLPPDWDAKTWNQFKGQIDEALKAGTGPAAVAGTWGIPVPWMVKYAGSLA